MPITEKQYGAKRIGSSESFHKPTRRELLADALSMWEEPFPEREKPKRCRHENSVPLTGTALREAMGGERGQFVICVDCGWIMGLETE